MSHVRTQLRDAAIAAIVAGVPGFDGRVEKARGFGRNMDRLPVAEISTPGEQATGDAVGLLTRDIELSVTVHVAAGGPGVEDDANALAVEIEKALYGSSDFMAIVKELTPESMSFEVQGEGSRRVGEMQMSWSCIVQTEEADPETAI
jgi:hypothetical protein